MYKILPPKKRFGSNSVVGINHARARKYQEIKPGSDKAHTWSNIGLGIKLQGRTTGENRMQMKGLNAISPLQP